MSVTTFTYTVGSGQSPTTTTDAILSTTSYVGPPTDLESVICGTSATAIGDICFSNASSLNNFTFSNTITSIGANSFDSCTSLPSITLPNNVTLGADAFFGCSALNTLTFGSTVGNIPLNCFRSCSSLTNVTIPSGPTSIGSNAFRNCSNLINITIPYTVTTIGSLILSSLPSALQSIDFINAAAASLTTVASDAFTFAGNGPSTTFTFHFAASRAAVSAQMDIALNYVSQGGSTPNETIYAFDAACYLETTPIIAIVNGLETLVPIMDLKTGDLIKTYMHGFKPIKLIGKTIMRNNPNDFKNCIYVKDDIAITGGHFLLVDESYISTDIKLDFDWWYKYERKIDDKLIMLACHDTTFKPLMDTNIYTIYHIVLEGTNDRYGIYVGEQQLLSESTNEDTFIKTNFL